VQRVPEPVVVVLRLHEDLDALKGHQQRFARAGQQGAQGVAPAEHVVPGGTSVAVLAPGARHQPVVHAEH